MSDFNVYGPDIGEDPLFKKKEEDDDDDESVDDDEDDDGEEEDQPPGGASSHHLSLPRLSPRPSSSGGSLKMKGSKRRRRFLGASLSRLRRRNSSSSRNLVASVKKPKGWGKRHTLAILGFIGFCQAYAMRFNLSIAIVAMVASRESQLSGGPGTGDQSNEHPSGGGNDSGVRCPFPEGYNATLNKTRVDGEFNWDATQQGLLLGAFFWGYPLTQIPGGWITSKCGGKLPMGVGLLVSGIMTVLIPFAARTNIAMIIYCRIIQGLAQGVIFPGMQQLLAQWSPPSERSFLSAMTYTGCQFGAALSMVTSGYLISSGGGWPSIFYITGSITILWFFFWHHLVHNSPAEHPSIKPQEKLFIEAHLGPHGVTYKDVRTPWCKILKSRPVWVISFADLCHSWGFYTLLIELPTFLRTVLHYDIQENSLISAVPSLFMLMTSIGVTYIADHAIYKKWIRIVTARKICHLIAELGSAACLVGTAYVECDRLGAVILLTFAAGINGAICGSFTPNQADIACNHSGAIMSITNTCGNLVGFLVSIVVSHMTSHGGDPNDWKNVFYLAAIIYVISAVVYTLFATSKEQAWNRLPKRQKNPLQTTSSSALPTTTPLHSTSALLDTTAPLHSTTSFDNLTTPCE